jgi:hypothetical protein
VEWLTLTGEADVQDGIAKAAWLAGVSVERVEDAYAVATRYAEPQRAMTCALLGVRMQRIRDTIRGNDKLERVLAGCAHPCAYAVWLATPLTSRMTDSVFMVAMRMSYALPVLSGNALKCQTLAGREGKKCMVKGIRADDFDAYGATHPTVADEHALTCKCGGGGIHGHDGVVTAFANTLVSWGLLVRTERSAHLPPNMRIDADVPLAADPGAMGLEIDFTKGYDKGRAELLKVEEAKIGKYNRAFEAEMTVRGAAFNQFAELGPRAQEVVDRVVALAANTTGSHPDDLRLELLAAIGNAIHFGNASALAHFREINNDVAGHAPLKTSLTRRGQAMATGVAGKLSGGRGRGRPRKIATLVRSAGVPSGRTAAGVSPGTAVANDATAGADAVVMCNAVIAVSECAKRDTGGCVPAGAV